MSHPNPRGRGGGTRGQGQSKRGAKGKSRAIPSVDEDGQEMGPAVGTGTSKKNITWEKNHSHRTSWLIAWCKANEDACIKLFSDSGKDAKEQGRKKKQSGTSKDTYYLQLANAIFSKDEDPEVQLLFQKDPKSFIKPIQSRFGK
jgi:hypothetical protein